MDGNPAQFEAGTLTSTTLLSRVAGAADEAADRAFVERYAPMVRAVARACRLSEADAEDLAQEVMIGSVEALRRHRYDRGRGRFRRFLKGVIAHKVRDALAGKRRDHRLTSGVPGSAGTLGTHGSEPADASPSPAETFEAAFDAEWQKVAMEEALDEIRREVEPVTFQAFDLYFRKDMSAGKVAKLLGVSRNVVYIAKTRVLARLKELLSEDPA